MHHVTCLAMHGTKTCTMEINYNRFLLGQMRDTVSGLMAKPTVSCRVGGPHGRPAQGRSGTPGRPAGPRRLAVGGTTSGATGGPDCGTCGPGWRVGAGLPVAGTAAVERRDPPFSSFLTPSPCSPLSVPKSIPPPKYKQPTAYICAVKNRLQGLLMFGVASI